MVDFDKCTMALGQLLRKQNTIHHVGDPERENDADVILTRALDELKSLSNRWDKLLDYVTREEDRHYELAGKEMDKGNTSGMMLMQLQAGAFQRVRYFMETITEEGK